MISLAGDAIGWAIVSSELAAVLEVANARCDLGLAIDHDDVGFVALKKHGTMVPDELLERAHTYDGIKRWATLAA